jgi:hypothetical protein
MNNPHRHLFLIMVEVGRQDFTTCLPGPPPSPTRDVPGYPVTPHGSFQYRIDFYQALGSPELTAFIVWHDRTWP